MSRLRIAAAALACLTLLIAGLFALNDTIGGGVTGGTALAALCLAIVVPFNADEPSGRKRILAAAIAFVALTAASLWVALRTAAGGVPVILLAGLGLAGLLLTAWAFITRNRRRRPAWSKYYDV